MESVRAPFIFMSYIFLNVSTFILYFHLQTSSKNVIAFVIFCITSFKYRIHFPPYDTINYLKIKNIVTAPCSASDLVSNNKLYSQFVTTRIPAQSSRTRRQKVAIFSGWSYRNKCKPQKDIHTLQQKLHLLFMYMLKKRTTET